MSDLCISTYVCMSYLCIIVIIFFFFFDIRTTIIKALNELPVYFCNEFFCSNLVASGFFCGFMADSWRKGAVLVLSSRGE